MNFSKINELKPYDLNCNIFDVYSYDGLSMQELLCQFFTKINECIKTSNETIDLAEWLVNEGLKQEVVIKLTNWLNDGTLENIINVTLFENLNKKIDDVSSQLEHNAKDNKYVNFLNFYVDDYTLALNDALIYANTNNKIVFIPNGEYSINDITVDDFIVEGMNNSILNILGSIKINKSINCKNIIFNGNSNNICLDLISTNERNIVIENCYFTNADYGLHTNYSIFDIKSMYIKNSSFKNLNKCGIRLNEAIIENCEISKNVFKNIGNRESKKGIGMTLGNVSFDGNVYSKNVNISNNYIENMISMDSIGNDSCQSAGILFYGKDCIIENNTVKNILGKGADHEGIYVKGSNCLIKNNYIENGGQGDGYITSKYYNKGFLPNRIIGNKMIGSDGGKAIYSVNVSEISDNIVDISEDDNFISENLIYISDPYSKQIEIKNNTIKCNYISDVEHYIYYFYQTKFDNIYIKNNKCIGDKCSALKCYATINTSLFFENNTIDLINITNTPIAFRVETDLKIFNFNNNNVNVTDTINSSTSALFNLNSSKNNILYNNLSGESGRLVSSFKGDLNISNNNININFANGIYVRNGVNNVTCNNNIIKNNGNVIYFNSYDEDLLRLNLCSNIITSDLTSSNVISISKSTIMHSKLITLNNVSNIKLINDSYLSDLSININNNVI